MNDIQEVNPVRSAFDAIAETFDDTFENAITKGIRERIHEMVLVLAPVGGRVLDINCGTGIDALAYAEAGFDVVGCDLSQEMVDRAEAKRARLGVAHAKFFQASFEHLGPLPFSDFNVVTSNFGGLNCIPDLSRAASEIARVTAPGAFFLAVVMPPVSLWEIISNSIRGQWARAFRRLRDGTPATGFHSSSFMVSYHAPGTFCSAFRPWFELHSLRGINVISPPPHAVRFASRWPRLTRFLNRIDGSAAALPVLRAMGDHYVVVLSRTGKPLESHESSAEGSGDNE